MSLETHIAGGEDRLLDSLTFAGKSTASYVTERRNCTFAPQSGGNFSTSGIRLLRFNLADQQGWLDAGTLRLAFSLTNNHASADLTPIVDNPASMFRRLRVIANGSCEIENIEQYSRVNQMFNLLLPSARRYCNISETWGGKTGINTTLADPVEPCPIPHGASRRVLTPLLSSFLSQNRWIPLSMIPVVLELELDDADTAFAGTGNNWVITRPVLLADVCSMDQALQNSFSKHLLDGKSLPYSFHGLYSLKASIADSTQFSLPICRGFTRLSTVYFSFIKTGEKESTYFYHPLEGAEPTEATDLMKYNCTLGGDRYPQFDVECDGEQYYRLRLASLMHTGTDSFSMSSLEFRNDSAVFAINLEKAPGAAGHTGVNTRSGSQLTINLKYCGAHAAQIHVIMHFDCVLNCSAAGCELLD